MQHAMAWNEEKKGSTAGRHTVLSQQRVWKNTADNIVVLRKSFPPTAFAAHIKKVKS